MAAPKHTNSPEAKEATNRPNKESDSTLSGIPSTSTAHAMAEPYLTGVPGSENTNKLLDLVTNRDTDIAKTVDPVGTEEELEVADALLSLGEVWDDTLEDDDNSQLMPVGAPSNIIDVAPVPVKLDQINIDNAIANIVQGEELDKEEENASVPVPGENDEGTTKTMVADNNITTDAMTVDTEKRPKSSSPMQGSLKIKTHALKKKVDSNRRYKCLVCGVSKPSMQLVNEHHLKKHKPQVCSICGRFFCTSI